MARMRLLNGLRPSGESDGKGDQSDGDARDGTIASHRAGGLPTRARVFGRFPPKDTSLATDSEKAEVREDVPAASASVITTNGDRVESRNLADEPTRLTPVVPVEAPVSPTVTPMAPTAPSGPSGPKPRASLLATMGLILGVVSMLAVLTGVLAKAGVILAVIAGLFSVGGLSATSRRHVAGRFDAIVGMLLSIGAIVLGVLAISGLLSWLTTDVDQVPRLRDWLHDRWAWVLSLRP